MDLRVPDIGGINAMIAIRSEFPEARIVVAHGGRIEIDTAPGRGTRVTLLFPLEAA